MIITEKMVMITGIQLMVLKMEVKIAIIIIIDVMVTAVTSEVIAEENLAVAVMDFAAMVVVLVLEVAALAEAVSMVVAAVVMMDAAMVVTMEVAESDVDQIHVANLHQNVARNLHAGNPLKDVVVDVAALKRNVAPNYQVVRLVN